MHTTTRIALGFFLIAGLLPSKLGAQVSSCTGQPNGTACEDGNTCTSGDRCTSEICIAPVRFTAPAAGSPIGVAPLPFANVAVDVNHDGKPDLIVLNYGSHTFTVLLGDGAGGFAQPPGSPVPTPSGEQTLTVADFNVDGNPDVAIASGGSGGSLISVHLGDGAGGFTLATGPFAFATSVVTIATGDLNRDGKPDLITKNNTHVWVLLGNGAGGFTTAPGSPVASGGPGTRDGLVGDFNRDGNPDVAVTIQVGGRVSILLGDGTGRLVMAPGSPIPAGSAQGLAAGDFNRDGKPDLVTAGQTSVSVLMGDGSGEFAASTVLTAGGYFLAAAVGDFSRDGKPDIAVLNYWTAEFSILLGDGTGRFVEQTDPSFGGLSSPITAPVADFNLDGKPDLAVSNFGTSTISIFLNDVGAPNATVCSDGNACTSGDSCTAGTCHGGFATSCNDTNSCTNDVCNPVFGCLHTNNANPCNDGNACTTNDTCGGGTCHGVPATPPETGNLIAAADKTTYSWSMAASANAYDAVRGAIGSLPVGPGGGDELCFEDLLATSVSDASVPLPDTGFWYLSRGVNTCGAGTYGTRSDGSPRTTTSCP